MGATYISVALSHFRDRFQLQVLAPNLTLCVVVESPATNQIDAEFEHYERDLDDYY